MKSMVQEDTKIKAKQFIRRIINAMDRQRDSWMTGAPRRLQVPVPRQTAVFRLKRIRAHGAEVRSVLTPFLSQGRKFTARA